jgi:hypothetical protein
MSAKHPTRLTPELIAQVAKLPRGIAELKKARQELREQRDKQARELRGLLDHADELLKAMDLAIDGLQA